MTKNTSRKKYTPVFKTQAVEMAALRGDISAVAQELQVNETICGAGSDSLGNEAWQ